jgi:ubiquinone/menaquinone biosynthesis C-methylase UbiE
LLEHQYGTTDKLRARITLHERFSTSAQRWPDWVFEHYAFPEDADVLEVGCGDGSIWLQNLDRIRVGWRLTLTDMSAGMVDAAREALGDRATYAVADAQGLPFEDETFDGAIANHVLFHVPDRPRALGELARVLRPDALLVGTMIGREHFKETRALVGEENVIWSESRERFGLETARPQLEQFFVDVEIEPFPDSLEVTEVEPLLDFMRSLDTPGLTDEHLREIGRIAGEEIRAKGAFHVTKSSGRFQARKP